MEVTLAQMNIKFGDKPGNLKKAIGIIEGSASDLILLPELFTTGFDFQHLKELAEEVPGETTDKLAEACGDSMVGGSILEEYEGSIYNTFVLLDKERLLSKYRKIHLFNLEKEHLSGGEEVEVVDTSLGKFALAICYDIRFPEMFRGFARKGAEVALVVAGFPVPREEHWEVLLRARAIEDQFFVIAVNRVGEDPRQGYFGRSMAISPWGKVLIKGGGKEEILSVEIDPSEVERVRRDFPALRDIKLL
jgi:predicted amidohydrolase